MRYLSVKRETSSLVVNVSQKKSKSFDMDEDEEVRMLRQIERERRELDEKVYISEMCNASHI